jgi:hypothetical protein
MYANFSFGVLPRINPTPLVANYSWEVESGMEPLCTGHECPPCPSGEVQGRWITNASSAFSSRLVHQLHSTHIYYHSPSVAPESNETRFKVVDPSILRWQPLQQCTIEPTPAVCNHWNKKCNPDLGLICFAGDSQMRHLYSMAVAVMSQDFGIVSTAGATLKVIPASLWSRYVGLKFGDRAEFLDLRNCSTLALNIGQWPISYTAGPRPRTLQRYRRTVQQMIAKILDKNQHLQGRIAWVSTHPHGIVKGMHGSDTVEPKDWRTDPYIMQQSVFAANFASRHRPAIRYIDTFGILYPLSDFAYDGAHYLGTPGFWSAALALHNLCG